MICTQLDDFILEKDKAFWRAELSNGLTVYQDDYRPGLQHSAWLRLKEYCSINNVFVAKMWITFRSHTEFCGESTTGFFFTLGIKAYPNSTRQEDRFICGPIIDGNIHVNIWKVPEIITVESEIRSIEGNEEKTICINH